MRCRYKKNVDYLLRLRLSRHRQTPFHLKRAKVHAIRRELQLQFLMVSNLANLDKQESKSGCSSYMLMLRIEIAFAQQTPNKFGLYSLNRNFHYYISLSP